MITIKIKRNEENKIVSFSLNGHAGYEAEGKDIVCAAVSAVTNMVIIGLNEKLKVEIRYEQGEKGYLKCDLLENPDSEKFTAAEILLESMVEEFKDIESNYGKYILVQES